MSPEPAWQRYANDRDALISIVINHQIEIARAEKLIEFLKAECTEINNYLYQMRETGGA